MSFASLTALLLTMIVLSATPGPSDFVLVAHTLRHGMRSALLMILGIILADFIFIVLAMLGLGLVAETLGGFFVLVKLVCVLFLGWLGLRAWRASPSVLQTDSSRSANASGFATGLLITLGDPKAILFYLALLPAFVDMQNLQWSSALLVMLCATLAIGLVKTCYAWLAQRVSHWFANDRARIWLNRMSALVLFAVALFLLVDIVVS